MEGDADHALDAAAGEDGGLDGDFFGLVVIEETADLGVLAFGIFADDDQIDLFVLPQRERRGDAFVELRGADVGVLVEGAADGEQQTVQRDVVRDFGVADGAEQDGFGPAEIVEETFRRHAAVGEVIIRAPVIVGVIEREAVFGLQGGEDAFGFWEDFLADAIAGDDGNPVSVHEGLILCLGPELAETGWRDFDPEVVGLVAPGFAGHVDDEAVAEIGADGVRAFEKAGLVDADAVVAGFGDEVQFFGTRAERDAGAFETAAQMGAVHVLAEHADAAGLAAGIEGEDLGFVEVEVAEEGGHGRGAGVAEEVERRAAVQDAAGAEEQDMVGEGEAFVLIVRDQQHRDAEGGFHFEDDGVEVGAEGGVEAAARFIEEEGLGFGDQGAGDGGALFLSAGEFAGVAAGEVGQFEAFEEFGDAAVAFEAGQTVGGKGEVFAHGHVREEGVVLEDVAAGAFAREEMDFRAAVVEDAVAEEDASGVGLHEAGDGVEREGFAGAAGSVEDGDAGVRVELDVEAEAGGFGTGGEVFRDVGLHHADLVHEE